MDIYKHEVLAIYGTQQAAADALGIGRGAVAMWPEDKPIPERHALMLQFVLKPDVFKTGPAKRTKAA